MTQRRLQIGMWDQFTEERWERLADKHISGMEISSFPNREALVEISDFAVTSGSRSVFMPRFFLKRDIGCLKSMHPNPSSFGKHLNKSRLRFS